MRGKTLWPSLHVYFNAPVACEILLSCHLRSIYRLTRETTRAGRFQAAKLLPSMTGQGRILLLRAAVDGLVQEAAAADHEDDEGNGQRAHTRRTDLLDGGAHLGLIIGRALLEPFEHHRRQALFPQSL